MGVFRNPNFIAEFTYRTKWNYYQLRMLQETDKVELDRIQNELDELKTEMKSRNYVLDDFYEITQLINSLVGLLVFPEQVGYDYISNNPEELDELFPTLAKCVNDSESFYCNYVYKDRKNYGKPEELSPKNVIRHMRNAVSHNRLGIYPVNGRLETGERIIKGITFKDYDELKEGKIVKKQMHFKLYVSVDDLEKLIMEICNQLLHESR